MRFWGKSESELAAERNEMIARREFFAQRDQAARDRLVADMIRTQGGQRAMTAVDLGQHYANAMQPLHFGTDIPRPTWREVEDALASRGHDDAGHGGRWVFAAALMLPLALGLALLYLILTA